MDDGKGDYQTGSSIGIWTGSGYTTLGWCYDGHCADIDCGVGNGTVGNVCDGPGNSPEV